MKKRRAKQAKRKVRKSSKKKVKRKSAKATKTAKWKATKKPAKRKATRTVKRKATKSKTTRTKKKTTKGKIVKKAAKRKTAKQAANKVKTKKTAVDRAGKTVNKKNQTSKINIKKPEYIRTGIPGFDQLFEKGIPKGSAILVSGGAGAGKTIFCLQTLMNHAANGRTCLYMSFEESEEKLIQHMIDFGWDPQKAINSKKLLIKRYSPFDITRSVEAMLAKEKGELLIDFEPVILPKGFKPDIIALDSLNAVASAFIGNESTYRIYIEQLFRFFEKLGSTSFLVSETKQMPEVYSHQGIEEFLADGVIVFYHYKKGHLRKNAVEILKLRGAEHQKRIVFMKVSGKGIIVYPRKEVLEGVHWTSRWGKNR